MKNQEISTIYVTPNFCDCRLCRGSTLPQTNGDRALRNFQRVLGLRVYETGGRNPDMVTYHPDVISRVEWSARGNVQDAENYEMRPWTWPEALRLRDSVHGCEKRNLLQEVSFHVRLDWNGHLVVEYTRPWEDSFHKVHRHPLATTMTLREWRGLTETAENQRNGNFSDLPDGTLLRVKFSQLGEIEGASPLFEK